MLRQLMATGLALALVGCGGIRNPLAVTVEPAKRPQAPMVDCRPYPAPAPIIIDPIKPEPHAEGWMLTHQDYLRVYEFTRDTIRFAREVRETLRHFVVCIEIHNDQVKRWNKIGEGE